MRLVDSVLHRVFCLFLLRVHLCGVKNNVFVWFQRTLDGLMVLCGLLFFTSLPRLGWSALVWQIFLRHWALLCRQQQKPTTKFGFLASRFMPSIFKTYSLQLSTLSAKYNNNNNKNPKLQLPTDFAKYQSNVCAFSFLVRCVRLLNLAFPPPFHLLPANQPQPTNPRCNRAFLPTNKNTCLKCWTSGRDIMATPTKLGRSEWQQHHRMEWE